MPVNPGLVWLIDPSFIGSENFLSSFCDFKVLLLNTYGSILLSDTVVVLNSDTKFEFKISFLLFANCTVDPLILLIKYNPSLNKPVPLTTLVAELPESSK